MGLPLTPLAARLPSSVPFVGPEAQERAAGRPFRARLGANESAFGPSHHAIDAMARAAGEVWRYGDPEAFALRAAIAAHHGVAVERVAVGEGIDGLLQVVARLFVGEGTPVVSSAGAYPTFNYHVAGFGGRLVLVPYRDDREDLAALVEAAGRERAALVYVANPDNPMGTWHDAAAVEAAVAALPEATVLCLDEAYGEFAPEGTLPAATLEHPRLVRLRTFSKAYGMAGARIGYAITTREVARAFNKVRNHFGVNRIAQEGALASLGDAGHLARVRAEVEAAKARIAAVALGHGLAPLASATNFVTLDVGADGATARALVAALAARGVFVRMPFVPPQDRCIRVTAAPAEMLDVFEAELGPSLDHVRAARAAA
ncbi:pyridoxal phosphate-dependent aminotransferase [Acuticoccus sp.]|uniref:pyridoxal phosphate-dependent aminotransferase n=1 Tax=Acuticoccus sp. TaxID=1904378 RepID=UPI003B52027E